MEATNHTLTTGVKRQITEGNPLNIEPPMAVNDHRLPIAAHSHQLTGVKCQIAEAGPLNLAGPPTAARQCTYSPDVYSVLDKTDTPVASPGLTWMIDTGTTRDHTRTTRDHTGTIMITTDH